MNGTILTVDAGNTRLKWGLWQDGAWRRKGVLPAGEAGCLDAQIMPARPEKAFVSCVAGDAPRAELAAALARLGGGVTWLQASAQAYGLRNAYAEPARLGPDRYAMLVACLHLGLAPCVVVGAGTAVTVDALDGEGRFLGGLILPGPTLMRRALVSGTAGVREQLPPGRPKTVAHAPAGGGREATGGGYEASGRLQDFPRCTGDGVETGIWRALAGAVADLRSRLARAAGMQPLVVLSGGEATMLAAVVDEPRRVVEDLVLEGLLWIARCSDAQAR